MRRKIILPLVLILSSVACTLTTPPLPSTPETTPQSTSTAFAPGTDPVSSPAPTEALATPSTEPPTGTSAPSETASPFPTETPLPTVERLKANVTADLLSCRYGPGAEYLYLYALRK